MANYLETNRKLEIIKMLVEEDAGEREICRVTGVSRPTIKKIAASIGHNFARNGYEVQGTLSCCRHCRNFFRRPKSKLDRAKNTYCSVTCKNLDMRGPNHPSWKEGASIRSFSDWVVKQAPYGKWRKAVMERDGYKCTITGSVDNLEAHHILPKGLDMSPENVFNVNNGITVDKRVHLRVHQLIDSGVDPVVAIDQVRKEYDEHKGDRWNIKFNKKEKES
jgi:5-methylcytosine-specific restriction endonuclease McrA